MSISEKTTKSGSPLPTYLTQTPRQSPITPISKTQFQILQSGIRYAYSGPFGSGAEAAVSVTLLNIGDSGERDLKCQMAYALDFTNLAENSYSGFSLSINGEEVFFTKGERSLGSGGQNVGPTIAYYDFILPAHSALIVLGIAQDTNTERVASITGYPL